MSLRDAPQALKRTNLDAPGRVGYIAGLEGSAIPSTFRDSSMVERAAVNR